MKLMKISPIIIFALFTLLATSIVAINLENEHFNIISSNNNEQIATFSLYKNKLTSKHINHTRGYEEITLHCKDSTPWRLINEITQRLLEEKYKFKVLKVKSNHGSIELHFPSYNLNLVDYERWRDERVKIISEIHKPIMPSYESEDERVEVARLEDNGDIYYSYSGVMIEEHNANTKGKETSLILYIGWNCEFQNIIESVVKMKRIGYKNIIFIGGSSVGNWPPYYIPRNMKDMKHN